MMLQNFPETTILQKSLGWVALSVFRESPIDFLSLDSFMWDDLRSGDRESIYIVHIGEFFK